MTQIGFSKSAKSMKSLVDSLRQFCAFWWLYFWFQGYNILRTRVVRENPGEYCQARVVFGIVPVINSLACSLQKADKTVTANEGMVMKIKDLWKAFLDYWAVILLR